MSQIREQNRSQSHTALFSLCEVHSHWMERVYISSCLLAVPLRLHTCLRSLSPIFSSSRLASHCLPPRTVGLLILCMARFPLLWWSSAQNALFLSLCPYFQPYQLRFHESQRPSTSSTEGSPLHPQSSVPGTGWQFPAPWIAACLYCGPLLGHMWRPMSLTH